MMEIEPASMKPSGRCACCGKPKRTAWGFVYEDDAPRACYFVEWTMGHSDKTARFEVVLGRWSDDTTEDDRQVVSLEYRAGDYAVADATGRPAAEAGKALTKEEAQGSPLADEARMIARGVLETDERLKELA